MTRPAAHKPSPKAKGHSTAQYTIGIDLGGTKVAAALVDQNGKILQEARVPTVPPWMETSDGVMAKSKPTPAQVKKHIDYVVQAMADAAVHVLAPLKDGSRKVTAKNILGIGLASAGPMNIEKGTLEHPSNFHGWQIVPLVKLLETELEQRGLHIPVSFQNDAIAAALGEGWVGQAKGCITYCMITVGTGIGSGVILNKRPAQSQGMGSEWGHMLVNVAGTKEDANSFNERSVEGYASGTGLMRRAKARGLPFANTSELANAARSGDQSARDLFEDAQEALAALMYTLSLGFHPQKFVVSGGMIAIQDRYLPQAIKLYTAMMTAKNPAFVAQVGVAELGVEAGVIGAAWLPHLAILEAKNVVPALTAPSKSVTTKKPIAAKLKPSKSVAPSKPRRSK